jgi:hypothetical protein
MSSAIADVVANTSKAIADHQAIKDIVMIVLR